MILYRSLITSAVLIAGFSASAFGAASDPVSLGNFGDWAAYTYKAADSKVCYAVSQPKSTDTAKKIKRDPVFFIITDMPGRKIKGEVSTIIGYPFKEQSTVEVTVDDESFKLFTKGDGAWAESTEAEKKIVAALKSGKALAVAGTSWKGSTTTDHYSLTGVKAALAKIDAACK